MEELVTSGRIVDVIIIFMVIEALVLISYRWWTGLGPSPAETITNLSAGFCIALALRFAVVGGNWIWIVYLLGASLVAHLADMRLRWRN
jgi:hypothetical protein